jgi:hypothetical protein
MDTCEFCEKKHPSANHSLTCRILQNPTPSNESLLSLIKILVERIETLEDQRPQKTSQPNHLALILNNSEPPTISFESYYLTQTVSHSQLTLCFTGRFIFESDCIKNILSEWFRSPNLPIKAFETKPNNIFIYEKKWMLLNTYHLKKFLNTLTKKLVECQNKNLELIANNEKHAQQYCDFMMNICNKKPQQLTFLKKTLYSILTEHTSV